MNRYFKAGAGAIAIATFAMTGWTFAAPAAPTSSAVRFPSGFTSPIFVGSAMVYDPAAPATTAAPTTAAPTTAAPTTAAPTTATPTTATPTTATPTTATPTTAAPTTAAPTTAAPTTAAPTTTRPAAAGAAGCGLTSAAFCATFDAPKNGGTQTGDLDPTLWGVSRVADVNPGQSANGVVASHLVGCGSTTASPPPGDVRICNGQLLEAVNDGGGVTNMNIYPKQPFNFAGRTGTVTFDLSADSGGTHAAWPEFVITDKPVPGVRRQISMQPVPHAPNSVGFALDTGCSGQDNTTGVGVIFTTVNGQYTEVQGSRPNCITKGSSASMNHFEVRVSQSHIEVWGTDAGSKTLKQLAVENVNLNFTQGLVWMDDVHYNARKAVEPCACGTQFDHTFAWDNLGFDGPKTYRDLGFDVPLANVSGGRSINGDAEVQEGYQVGTGPQTFTVTGVKSVQTPTAAQVVLNAYSFNHTHPTVSVNGNAPIATTWAATDDGYMWRSMTIPVPLAQVHDGSNTLTFASADGSTIIANVSLILVAAAPVP
ncbi:MAG: hypothetical protein JWM12_2062 [Ilumatobacteraceae bacterium]|nr:hypothetical protein [Ilumatobacteraceae bacterium]